MPTGYSAGPPGEILTLAARYTRFTMVVDVGLSTDFGDRALDLETERLLFAQIAELEGRTTVLVVTHRPSLVELASRVFRVDSGRAIEEPALDISEILAPSTNLSTGRRFTR